jgi:hypothetical protein
VDVRKALNEIQALASFEKWPVVSPSNHMVSGWLGMACRPVTQDDLTETRAKDGPHTLRQINVYVNEAAKAAIPDRNKSPLPAGSAVVKAKHVPDSGLPKEIGAMIKREAGFDPAGGDWEYLFIGQSGKLTRGKIASCRNCHSGRASTDFLFLPYLDKEADAR